MRSLIFYACLCVCGVKDSWEDWNQNSFHLGMGSSDVVEAHAMSTHRTRVMLSLRVATISVRVRHFNR